MSIDHILPNNWKQISTFMTLYSEETSFLCPGIYEKKPLIKPTFLISHPNIDRFSILGST